MRRLALLALLSVAASAVIADAGDRPRSVASSASLRLPDIDRCLVGGTVRVTLAPPAGQTFQSLSVRAGSRELLQLADLAGAGSVLVTIPRRATRVDVGATTSSGRFLSATRTYERCSRRAASDRRARRKPPRYGPPVRILADD